MIITEMLEILFWEDRAAIQDFCVAEGSPWPPDHRERLNAFFLDTMGGQAGFLRRVERYAERGGAFWPQGASVVDPMGPDDLLKLAEYAGAATGARRWAMYENARTGWAVHLDDYAREVVRNDPGAILELSTGAGLGTCAVLNAAGPQTRLVSVDIDPMAARNADGIARHLGMDGRACGIPASFWSLPFADGLFDAVCAHYGLDESRETAATLAEAARVLKPGGRFVVTARADPYVRHRDLLDLFGFTQGECRSLLQKARLYSGPEDLACLAARYDLHLIEDRRYSPGEGHARCVMVMGKE